MATQWKYKHGNQELGPVTSAQLKKLATAGKLAPDDLVWKEGLSDWVAARRVKGLFDADTQNAAAALSGLKLGETAEKNPAKAVKDAASASPRATANLQEKVDDDEGTQESAGSDDSNPSQKLPRAQPLPQRKAQPSKSQTSAINISAKSSAPRRRRKIRPQFIVFPAVGVLAAAAIVLVGRQFISSDSSPDERAWKKLDFVLLGDGDFAVGIQYDSEEARYQLRAEAAGEQVGQALTLAKQTATPLIRPDDPRLAGYISRKHAIGDTIEQSLAKQVALYWPIDQRPWLAADFLIDDTNQFAVAVKAHGEESLELLAKARGKTAVNVVQFARDAGVRIIRPIDDERLVADLYRSADAGATIAQSLAGRIANYWPLDSRGWLGADFILRGSAGHAVAVDYQEPEKFFVLAVAAGPESKLVDDLAQRNRIPTVSPVDGQLASLVYRKCQPSGAVETQLCQKLLDYWPVDASSWRKADLVMVNPTEIAAAVKYQEDDNYELLAMAKSPNSQRAVQVAWKARIPVIARDPQLTRKLQDETVVGSRVDAEISRRISEYWRSYSFLPESENFVAFRDVQLRQWRVGFLLEETAEQLVFQPLTFDKPANVTLARVEPGSLVKVQGMDGLRELRSLQFLDYCATQIGRALQTPQGQRSHVYVVVNPVKVDINAEELVMSKTLDTSWADDFFAFQARALGTTYRHDPRKEPARILRHFAESLQAELQTRLSRIHVPLLERDELKALLAERGRTSSGLQMSDVVDQPLIGPTHIIFSEIRHSFHGGDFGAETQRAARRGEFELAVRLVDVRTGEIVWTDQMWPPRYGAGPSGIPNYLLDSGELVLLEPPGKREDARPSRGESWPIKLPTIKLPAEGRKIQLSAPRLGYLEQDGSPIQFRDLFSKTTVELPADAVAVRRVRSSADVPEQHRMRYLVWQIARRVLPAAARVTDLQGAAAKIGLGDAHGLQSGSELRVVRIDSVRSKSTLSAERMLQVQIRVAQTGPRSSQVFVAGAGAADLQTGDIVFQQQTQKSVVAIVSPRAGLFDAAVRQQFSRWNDAQLRVMLDKAGNRANDLTSRLFIALEKLNIEVRAPSTVQSTLSKFPVLPGGGLSKEQAATLADELGVTHLVYGEVTPTYHVNALRASDRLTVDLKIFETATAKVVTLPRFDLHARQFEKWQP